MKKIILLLTVFTALAVSFTTTATANLPEDISILGIETGNLGNNGQVRVPVEILDLNAYVTALSIDPAAQRNVNASGNALIIWGKADSDIAATLYWPSSASQTVIKKTGTQYLVYIEPKSTVVQPFTTSSSTNTINVVVLDAVGLPIVFGGFSLDLVLLNQVPVNGSVPEPHASLLLGATLLGFIAKRRR